MLDVIVAMTRLVLIFGAIGLGLAFLLHPIEMIKLILKTKKKLEKGIHELQDIED